MVDSVVKGVVGRVRVCEEVLDCKRCMKPLLPRESLKITHGDSRGRKNGKAAEQAEWSSMPRDHNNAS